MSLTDYKSALASRFRNAYLSNDSAHRTEHFDDVLLTGLYINERLELGYNPLAILLVAYIHDLFAWSRDNHHQLSWHFMMTTQDPLILEILQRIEQESNVSDIREAIAYGCLEHRASYKGAFTNTFSQLMNSADRGMPKGVESILARAYAYARDNNPPTSVQGLLEISIAHLKDKFSRNGYARYPEMYQQIFSDELEELWDAVDDLALTDELLSRFLDKKSEYNEVIDPRA